MAEDKVETFTFTKEVPCADADGKPIKEGSVLVNVKDNARGIVIAIGRKGDISHLPMFSVGDLAIRISGSHGTTRITNKYSEWRHIPHNMQTYRERYEVWLHTKYEHDEDRGVSRDEGLAINGIMALLPDDTVNWEWGPWPDKLEDALSFLVEHMSLVKTKDKQTKEEHGKKQSG